MVLLREPTIPRPFALSWGEMRHVNHKTKWQHALSGLSIVLTKLNSFIWKPQQQYRHTDPEILKTESGSEVWWWVVTDIKRVACTSTESTTLLFVNSFYYKTFLIMGKGGGELTLLVGLQLHQFPCTKWFHSSKNFLFYWKELRNCMLANVRILKYNILIFQKLLGLFL